MLKLATKELPSDVMIMCFYALKGCDTEMTEIPTTELRATSMEACISYANDHIKTLFQLNNNCTGGYRLEALHRLLQR
jgi:hypothetical protein